MKNKFITKVIVASIMAFASMNVFSATEIEDGGSVRLGNNKSSNFQLPFKNVAVVSSYFIGDMDVHQDIVRITPKKLEESDIVFLNNSNFNDQVSVHLVVEDSANEVEVIVKRASNRKPKND